MHRTNKGGEPVRRLWIVTELYYPEVTSTGYYLTTIAESLAGDRPVTVLTGQPTYAARGQRAPRYEIRNGVEIIRAWGTTLDKNVLPFRLLNMFTIAVSIFLKGLVHFRAGDQVLVVTAPQSLPFTTALASLTRGAGYTLLVHDSYPEILIAVGAVKPTSLLVKTVNIANRWVYKHAARIIVMGRDMHQLFLRKTAGLDVPVVTIQNWAETEAVKPEHRDQSLLLNELGLAEKFVFLFAGNLGHPIDLETLVESAEELQDLPSVHFLFIGSGAKQKWLKDRVKQRTLTNVTVLDERPRSEQRAFLNACDVGIVSLVKGMLGTAMPSKTYNIMAAGRPILALTEKGSEVAQVIDEERIGWYADPGNTGELVSTIRAIFNDQSELEEMGLRARKAAIEKYSPEAAMEKYRRALE